MRVLSGHGEIRRQWSGETNLPDASVFETHVTGDVVLQSLSIGWLETTASAADG